MFTKIDLYFEPGNMVLGYFVTTHLCNGDGN